ncbi:cell division protein ZipA [Aestuariirhabdus sp. LZHN29]|uniref:cell division protein ZipA n=1 Tax=Aestuariirhabdus sp. LZHN29 TaxID=3417462 RepID=UPI003CEEACD0
MDMGVRGWLVAVAVVLILGILADGYRRMRAARRRPKDLEFSFGDGDEDFNNELPNGGARVILSPGDKAPDLEGAAAEEENDPLFMPPPRQSSVKPAPPQEPSQEVEGNEAFGSALDETLGYSAEAEPFVAESGFTEPSLEAPFDSEPEIAAGVTREPVVEPASRGSAVEPQHDSEPLTTEPVLPLGQVPLNLDEPVPVLMEVDAPSRDAAAPAPRAQQSKPIAKPKPKAKPTPEVVEPAPHAEVEQRPPAEEIVVINVIARNGQMFPGDLLLQQLLENGMKYGEMSIFHRHEQFNGEGAVQFSLANGVEPGSFDLDHMDQLQTPLVTLFMGLPGPKEPLKAFEMMATAAQTLARELGGELKDESRSVMTQQTLAHCKQRITEFERRQLTRERNR